ncbi:uncharacterized protein LOC120651548 [Panicum virgatum]|uniref:uncharacterized protein LOC120651548 n=1 Tax=Panicum virgatum TaxID=38727 RepID=UPI0019D5F73C|nr:uncharacterized protein LOC120651548 [Panicum virgatum]
MEAELKAASAREAAEAAARQEREAARLAASTSQGAEEEHVMALEVVLPEATNQTTTTRRSLFPGDALEVEVQAPRKMTPKKKKLATKVKKTPEKKGATKKK